MLTPYGTELKNLFTELFFQGVSPLPAGAVLLALCVCSLALVNLDGCKRSFVEVESAMEDEELRELIEKQLGKPLKDDDLITNFLVHDKNTTNSPMCFSSEEMRYNSSIYFIRKLARKSIEACNCNCSSFLSFFLRSFELCFSEIAWVMHMCVYM